MVGCEGWIEADLKLGHGLRRALMTGVALFVLGAPSWALAQSQSPATLTPVPADTVGEVIVTAQRRSENLQAVPLTVQAFTAADIQKAGIKSSLDLSQFTPNVDIGLPGGEGAQPIVVIRGIGLNDGNTNNAGPNGIYVDEVYLAAPTSQNFQVFDLKQIEVLKGPQGTLYGRNTSGGAINFVTAKPTDTFSGDILTSYSSFNTFNLEAAVGGPLAQHLDGRIAVTTTQSDGYMNNALTGNKENGQNSFAARGLLLYQPNTNLSILVGAHGGYLDTRPAEYRMVGTLDPNTLQQCSTANVLAGSCVDLSGYGTPKGFYDGAYNRQEHQRVVDLGGFARIEYDFGTLKLTSITAYDYNQSFRPEDTDAAPDRLVEANYAVQSNDVSQELRLSQSTKTWDWTAGLYYSSETLHQNQPLFILLDFDDLFGPGSGDGIAERAYDNSRQTTDSYAIFAQGDYHLTDQLKITLGGRYSYETKSFIYNASYQTQQGGINNFGPLTTIPTFNEQLHDGAFNYRAAVDYTLVKDVSIYGSIATGFKSGGFNGGFLSTDPAEIATQLRPVKPEHVTSYEAGVKAEFFDRRLRVDLAAFYNDYNNQQVFTLVQSPVPNNPPVNVLDNAPKAHTDGLDMSIVFTPLAGLTLTENFGYLQTRLDQYTVTRSPGAPDYTGNVLPLAPSISSSMNVDYRRTLFGGEADFQFSANYKSKQFFDTSNDPLTTQGNYWIENLRVAYRPSRFPNLEVAAYVHNLADTHYLVDGFDLSSPFGLLEDVVGRPRSFGGELNYRF